MFDLAAQKLGEAVVSFEHLQQAQTAQAFRTHFNATVNSTRSVWDVLKTEGKKVPGFDAWREQKWKAISSDDLLSRLNSARIGDFHRGEQQVAFGTHIDYLSTNDLGPPPTPDAAFVIGVEGPAWLVHEGTAKERRIPIQANAKVRFALRAGLVAPPKKHLGQALQRDDPITFCGLAIAYFEGLVYEARTAFGIAAKPPK